MEIIIDRKDFLRALNILTFSTYNTASSAIKIEIVDVKPGECLKGALHSCSGHFANRSYFDITSMEGVPEEKTYVFPGHGLLKFISSLPAETIKIKYMEKNLQVRGMWYEDGKENYTDQTYPFLDVKIPSVNKLLDSPDVIGTIQSSIFIGAVKFIKSFHNKDSLNPRVLTSEGKLVYLDEIKMGVFDNEGEFPAFSFDQEDITPILSFLDQYRNQEIKIHQFKNGPTMGFALESEDHSILVFAFNHDRLKEGLNLNIEDTPAIKFDIEVKKFLINIQLLKTNASQLFDEMDIIISPEGFMELRREPNFQSKLSIDPTSLPDEGVEIKVQFSNMIDVLKAFQGKVTIYVDLENKRLRITGIIDIPINENVKDEDGNVLTASCKALNILSYWNK